MDDHKDQLRTAVEDHKEQHRIAEEDHKEQHRTDVEDQKEQHRAAVEDRKGQLSLEPRWALERGFQVHIPAGRCRVRQPFMALSCDGHVYMTVIYHPRSRLPSAAACRLLVLAAASVYVSR